MPWWLLWKRKVQGADVARLEAWEPGGPSLAGGNFLGIRMPRQDLSGIDLSKANLTQADLRKADLERASLSGAELNHADLREANLRWASLRGAELVGANLQKANLKDANLSGILTRPHIPEDLKTAKVQTARTNLSGASLQRASLIDADLSGADLTGANLRQAHYSDKTTWPQGFQPQASGAIRCASQHALTLRQSIQVPGYGELPMGAIPPGMFSMGSSQGGSDETPRHEVQLPRGFLMGRTQVTQRLYRAVMGENPAYKKASDQHPVESVSWFDAVRFCNALSRACELEEAYTIGEGDEPKVSCRFDAHGFRLPTEAEWECAAKAGQDFKYSGSDDPDEVAWYDENSDDETHPVAQKKPNAWGLYDMSGNVWEWCWDWYDEDEYKNRVRLSGCQVTIINQPEGPKTSFIHTLRGGSYDSVTKFLRSSFRNRGESEDWVRYYGFRLVLPSPSLV